MRKNKKHYKNEKELSPKRDCPDALDPFIFDVNQIPENTVLRDYEDVWGENQPSFSDSSTKEEIKNILLEKKKEWFDKCFANFSESYKDIVLRDAEAWQLKKHPNYDEWNLQLATLDLALEHYQYIYLINNNLRAVADFFSHLRNNDYLSVNETELITRDGATITLPLLEAQLKREGTIGKIRKDLFGAFIDIDLDRIRTCEICNHIFWAKRTESSTCSPKHYETLKKRRARSLTDEEKAKRKAQREANKRFKAKPKSIRSK